MKPQVDIEELKICEKNIVDLKDYIQSNYGLERIMEIRSNMKRLRYVLYPLFWMGRFGFTLLYILLGLAHRKHYIFVYENKLVIRDHTNGVIEKFIFQKVDQDYGQGIKKVNTPFPLKLFMDKKIFARAIESYNRTHPQSPNAFLALAQFWVYFELYSYSFKKTNYTGVIVVDDLGPNRSALIFAAKENTMRTGLVKLVDQLGRECHFKSFDVLFCWNFEQSSEEKGKYYLVSHLPRSFKDISQLGANQNKSYNVGIALKSMFDPEGLKKQLAHLNCEKWVNNIIVRYHPSREPLILEDSYKHKLSGGDSAQFFKEIDILISGSTSLVKDALLQGIPVVYNASLDTSVKKDSYEYAKNGIVFVKEDGDLDESDLEKINLFYQGDQWKKLRQKWVAYDPEAVSLEETMEYLLNNELSK